MPDLAFDLPEARTLPPARQAQLRSMLESQADEAGGGRGRRWGAWLAAAAVAVGIAGAGVWLLPAQPAYASWTASPSALSPSQLTRLGTACSTEARRTFPKAASTLQPVLGDRRGIFQTALVAGAGQVALCADWAPGSDGAGVTRGSTLSGLTTDARLGDQTLSVIAAPGQITGDDAARVVYGLAAGDVSRVVVHTATGRVVRASVSQGYFLAWWPGGEDPGVIKAYDGAGRRLASVTASPTAGLLTPARRDR